MAVIFLVYLVPGFFLVMGIITGVRSWISRRGKDANDDSQSDNSKVGAEVYIITSVIWIVLAIFFIGTPKQFLKEKNDKEARNNEIIKQCKLVESGRKGGILSPDQDGYLCKDGVVYYINTRR
ncbi:hypothetical protein D8Y54_003857 [Escherichia coli]|nr:hypothetical protein [Escherichia coli]